MLIIIQKLFWLFLMIIITIIGLIYIPCAYIIRMIDEKIQYKIASEFFKYWLGAFNKILSQVYILEGDNIIDKNKNYFIISNHVSESDFLVFVNLFKNTNSYKYLRFVIKSQLKKYPILFNILDLLGFLFVERNYNLDKTIIENHMQKINKSGMSVNLILFPEGTIFNQNTLNKSRNFRCANNLHELNYVLTPKHKGFECILKEIKNSYLNELLDITFAYADRNEPSVFDIIFTNKKFKIYYKMEIIDVNKIEDSKQFLCSRWDLKENWLGNIFSTKNSEELKCLN